jgi:ABC-type sugar transport system ATPase subunit
MTPTEEDPLVADLGVKGEEAPGAAVPALRASRLCKSFDGVEVLHGADVELRSGEVHALVGENGAGKSTLINLLSGRLRPDAGHVELNGQPVEFRNPLAARRAGISVIAQELEVVPTLTVVENVFLGSEPTKFGIVRWRDARRRAVNTLSELGLDADPDRAVGAMGVADQQLVEIAKAVVGQFGVLIMDEPTSALNLEEVERLFRVVRRLKADGVAVLYVSHRLWEVFDLADRVTVVRDGNLIFTKSIAETNIGAVIRAMLGSKSSLVTDVAQVGREIEREVAAARQGTHGNGSSLPERSEMGRAAPGRAPRSGDGQGPVTDPPEGSKRPPAVELEGVHSGSLLSDINLTVHDGEVVGLAGVLGSGRTELCETMCGLRKVDTGTIRLRGVRARLREPMEALAHGVFALSEDRKSEGIFGHLDVRENVVLNFDAARGERMPADAASNPVRAWAGKAAVLIRKTGLTWVRARAERRAFDSVRASLGIRCSRPDERITALSGGNQQKALFARAALTRPAVLVLSEPTRGVDVGAKEEIYTAIDGFAGEGIAIIVSSAEISELMRLAARIYVIRNGRIVAQVAREEASEEQILRYMAG